MSKKLLALLMALVLVVGLTAGCSKSATKTGSDTQQGAGEETADSVVGNWATTLDVSDMLADYVKVGMGEAAGEMADYFDVDGLKAIVTYELSLNEDGSCSMRQKEKDPGTLRDTVMDMYAAGAAGLYADTMGMTQAELEEQLAAEGMTWQDYVDAMREQIETTGMVDEAMETMEASLNMELMSGYYKVDGNRIYMLSEKDGSTSGAEWMEYELKGGKLVIVRESDAPEELKDLYPIEFDRA